MEEARGGDAGTEETTEAETARGRAPLGTGLAAAPEGAAEGAELEEAIGGCIGPSKTGYAWWLS